MSSNNFMDKIKEGTEQEIDISSIYKLLKELKLENAILKEQCFTNNELITNAQNKQLVLGMDLNGNIIKIDSNEEDIDFTNMDLDTVDASNWKNIVKKITITYISDFIKIFRIDIPNNTNYFLPYLEEIHFRGNPHLTFGSPGTDIMMANLELSFCSSSRFIMPNLNKLVFSDKYDKIIYSNGYINNISVLYYFSNSLIKTKMLIIAIFENSNLTVNNEQCGIKSHSSINELNRNLLKNHNNNKFQCHIKVLPKGAP